MTTSVLVYDSSDEVSRETIGILEDWHASGWLAQLAFVSVAEFQRKGPDVANVVINVPPGPDSVPRTRRLLDLLDEAQVRIVALDTVGADDTWLERRENLHAVAKRLSETLVNRTAALDLIIAWHAAAWSVELDAWPQWDTLIAAPEHAVSVDQPGVPLYYPGEDRDQMFEVAAQSASFVASIAGLWTGIHTCSFDDTDAVDDVRLSRAAHRRVDATAVADRIRAVTLSPEVLRSQKAVSSTSTASFDARIRAGRDYMNLLAMPKREAAEAPNLMSFLQALKMFFGFMIAGMLRAPKDLLNGLVHGTQQRIANLVQGFTFGEGSGTVVNVFGVPAETGAKSLALTEASLDAIDRQLSRLPGRLAAENTGSGSQQQFWTHCLDTVFALVSGDDQGNAEAIKTDDEYRYLPFDLVAPPVGRWRPAGGLHSGVPIEGVVLTDVVAVRSSKRALQAAADSSSGGWSSHVDDSYSSLKEAEAPWAASFMGKLGTDLADGLEHYQSLVMRLLDVITNAKRHKDDGEAEIARKLNRFARIATALAAAAIALVWVLQLFVLPLVAAALLTVLVVPVWLGGLFVKFWSSRRALFQYQNRMRQAEAELSNAIKALPVAVENMRRMLGLCAQHGVWSRVVAAFLSSPFGAPEEQATDFPGMVGAMPKSVACGKYVDGDETEARRLAAVIADSMRDRVSRLWADLLRTGLDQLSAKEAKYARIDVPDVLGLVETGPDSPLTLWSTQIVAPNSDVPVMTADVAHRMDRIQMQRIVDRLDADLLQQLKQTYRIRQVGAGGRPREHRLSGRDRPAPFNTTALSHEGIMSEPPAKDVDMFVVESSRDLQRMQTRHWLDEIDTAVCYSRTILLSYIDLKPAGQSMDADADSDQDPELAEGM